MLIGVKDMAGEVPSVIAGDVVLVERRARGRLDIGRGTDLPVRRGRRGAEQQADCKPSRQHGKRRSPGYLTYQMAENCLWESA
jgi:hypothetical protein